MDFFRDFLMPKTFVQVIAMGLEGTTTQFVNKHSTN